MNSTDPVYTAWQIYLLVVDWIGKADSKAAFSLSIESAAVAGVIGFSRYGNLLSGIGGWRLVAFTAGLGGMGLAILLSVFAVLPRVGGGSANRVLPHQYVFFGHLRHWAPGELQEALADSDRSTLSSLAEQIVAVSRVAWYKHRLVQASLISVTLGVGAVAVGVSG